MNQQPCSAQLPCVKTWMAVQYMKQKVLYMFIADCDVVQEEETTETT